MEKKIRIGLKIVAIIILTLLLVWLIDTDETQLQKKQPGGELVLSEDVKILVDELVAVSGNKIDKTPWENLKSSGFPEGEVHLTYGIYEQLLDCLTGKLEPGAADSLKKELTYKNKYREDFFLLKSDWQESFERLLDYFEVQELIRVETVEILCSNAELTGSEQIGENYLLGATGLVYAPVSEAVARLRFTKVRAYVHENRLLTLLEILPEEAVLSNVYFLEAGEGNLQFFYKGYEITCAMERTGENAETVLQEQVGNLTYSSGKITRITPKTDRISGKLLTLSQDSLEIEGEGSFPIDQDCVGYRIFEELREASRQELMLGYDYTDFILENGKVCAFLITRKEAMESIRVAVKNNGFESIYHEKITLVCEDDMRISYGKYGERREEEISGGTQVEITPGCDYLSGDRVEITPKVNTGKIQVLSLARSQGIPQYRGYMEIAQTKEGLVLINEILLEEYLYSVVPSEMPASYPLEALKAQAICARTYACRYLKAPGYGAVGAHVDDSVSYQVYNNIAENSNSTKAVRETAGMLLLYQENPADTYYYSTSCGFGTDAGIWNEEQMDQTPFIQALHISDHTGIAISPEELTREENFQAYILVTDETAYEKEEPWYRWNYEVPRLDVELLYEKLLARYQAGAEKVLTYTGKGEVGKEAGEETYEDADAYEAKEPAPFKKVYALQCLKRRAGGVMDELLIETDKGTYKVISEYNIRAVLNQGGEVLRQDASKVSNGTLLPSAYFAIDVVMSGKNVIGYTINGGGYGHGAGMSQNGAKAMGNRGKNSEEILNFFFQDCETRKVY